MKFHIRSVKNALIEAHHTVEHMLEALSQDMFNGTYFILLWYLFSIQEIILLL